MFREQGLVIVLFLMPAVFVLLLTAAGVGNQGGRGNASILILDHDGGPVSQRIIQRLRAEKELDVSTEVRGVPLDSSTAEQLLEKRGSHVALIVEIPPGFSTQIGLIPSGAPPAPITFIEDSAADVARTDSVERLVKESIFGEVASVQTSRESASIVNGLSASEKGRSEQSADLSRQFSRAIDGFDASVPKGLLFVRATPHGSKISPPIKSIEQNVPAYTIFGIFFIVQVVATSLLRERENGTFLRLKTAPVSRFVLLTGKLLPYYLINVLQVLVLFTFGHFAFHLTLGSSPLALIGMTLATAAAANALGVFIASISKSQEQMGPMSALILIVLAASGGVFIPTYQMPKLMQTLSLLTPHAWAIRGFQDLIVRGYGLREVMLPIVVLLAYASFNYVFALRKFRFE